MVPIEPDDNATPQSPVQAFFAEYWPLVFFGSLFLLMFTIPLVMTGVFTLYGLLIAFGLLFGLLLALFAHRLLGLYVLLWAFAIFIFHPQAWSVGAAIALCFVAFAVIGAIILPIASKRAS